MIAVIADDLTGAAELGGIGLRYGLSVSITTEVEQDVTKDLLVISANTRSLTEAEAVDKIQLITTRLLALQPQLIYKKIDSVLRGHVVPELRVQMEVMQLQRALIVPANPSLNRVIKDGLYYFKQHPIHLSSFSKDPEFPVASPVIADMLRVNSNEVLVAKPGDVFPNAGMIVGEVYEQQQLAIWATHYDQQTVFAGASGFFTALLQQLQVVEKPGIKAVNEDLALPMLFVCGTTFLKSRDAIRGIKNEGGAVSYMPAKLLGVPLPTGHDYDCWCVEIRAMLSANDKVIIAIKDSVDVLASPADLSARMAIAVDMLLQQVAVKELIVEGGATAASIIQKMQFTQLIPVDELSAGVIRMQVPAMPGLHLTIKPGSYDWSPGLWSF